jgi:serine/threonine protein kinase
MAKGQKPTKTGTPKRKGLGDADRMLEAPIPEMHRSEHEFDASDSEAPISSVPPSTAALTAALNSDLPAESDSGPRGAILPSRGLAPDLDLDRLSDFPDQEGPSVNDDVYQAGSNSPPAPPYEELIPFGPPPEGPSSNITVPLSNPEPIGASNSSAKSSSEEDYPDDPDSRPPTIPSAAAVAGPAGVPTSLSQVGSEAYEGDVIAGRYRVDGVLGEGGMGIVYRCTDLTSQETVALKRVIVPETDHAEEYIMWFYKEARALAALDHPGIVGARDFGRLRDGSPFLTMDMAPGTSLHDLAHAGLKWPTVWHIVDQILGALAHAHARGIIHGDLKPSNVLVEEVESQPPLVHMLDFGLAWLKVDTHDERLDGEKSPEYKPHAGAGTPGYMAPEQIQHEQHHVCGATDLYSLGCILYRLIGRGPPFGGTPKELLRQHAFSEVPPLVPAIEAPAGALPIVMRMLAKSPWDRWEFAAEAHREWALLRPTAVRPEDYVLPRIRPASTRPLPKGAGFLGRNPNLDASTDRTTGLLSIRQSPLVGRTKIRQTLREICDEVIDGQGPNHRLVILVGPAGSGKSRIAEWLCQSVHEEGTMIPLWARYRAVRGPLDGVVGAVTRYYNFERADRNTIESSLMRRWKVQDADKNGRTWVAGAAEWFRPRGPGETTPVGPSGVRFTLDTLSTRRTVSRHVVRRVGQNRKLLFWLDDLHNASESTFEGFRRMHTEDADQPYVIVATVRAEEVHLGTPAAERLRRLRELMNGIAIDVTPLEPETTRELLRKSLQLEDDAVEEASRRSRGNPLFALQQIHAWALQGSMQLKNGRYHVPPEVLAVRPKTTAELWKSRLLAVPEVRRKAAFAVAAISSDLRREVLAALLRELGLPADDCIRDLQLAEILIPRGPERYSWPHALLQEYLSAELARRSDRTLIYKAAAEALKKHPLAATRRVVRQRVMNLILAGTPDAAANLLFGFLQDSWNGAREPLSTLSDLDLLRGRLSGRARAHQDRWRAEALRHVGRASEAREYIDRSLKAFAELGDKNNVAHCKRMLGHIGADMGNSIEGKRSAEEALLLFQETNDALGQAQTEAVLAEIGYLLGDFESARTYVDAGERHFAALDQPLGRGQCLLLSSWVEHSEGAVERSRRLALEARGEFERVGYRLGTAQANASLAHVEHRMFNFHAAQVGAEEALVAFESLRTPRGQAACRRLLAMVGIDTDDDAMAAHNTEWCAQLSADLDDPWGIVEAKVLEAQGALLRHDLDKAEKLLRESSELAVEEPEPHQHRFLTEAWLSRERGQMAEAKERIISAMETFPNRHRVGDHTVHLLARLSRFTWPAGTHQLISSWRATLSRSA